MKNNEHSLHLKGSSERN